MDSPRMNSSHANRQPVAASNLSLQRQPFFYVAAALITGILLDRFFEPAHLIAIFVVIFSTSISIAFITAKRARAATAALLFGFAASGAMLSSADRAGVAESRLKHLYDAGIITPADPVELTGVLALPPEPARVAHSIAAFYLDVDAESLLIRDELIPATGRARLMISLSDQIAKSEFEKLRLNHGSRLRVLVRLEKARSYANPGSPDFNEFLERRGYDLKGTIKSHLLVERLGRAQVNRAMSFLYALRLRMMTAVDRSFEPRIAGTIKAMLLGNRYFLDPEVSRLLRESATFHTLVISGLHITLIALVILRLPTRIRSPKAPRPGLTRTAIALLVIWAYAAMVGLAPPVLRASVMITIGLFGPLLFRQAASINSVSLAAFVMLAFDPALVADPGFQLSFIAVAAIVGLGLPLIKKLESIGEWRPAAETPRPPACSPMVRYIAETLFWNEREFNEDMRRSPVVYHVEKAKAARALSRVRLQWLPRVVVTGLIISTAIQLATMPLMAAYFNRVAPVGVLLNVMSGLLTAAMMFASIIVISIGALSAWFSDLLVWVVAASHYLLVDATKPFLSVSGATFRVAHYEGWQALVYALYFVPLMLMAVLIDRWRPVHQKLRVSRVETRMQVPDTEMQSRRDAETASPRRTAASLACVCALLVCIVAAARPAHKAASGKLAVHFLDVGQGDAALVVFPEGATMLVDAGGEIGFQFNDEGEEEFKNDFSIGEAVVSRFLWSQGRASLDYALATHAHADHADGFFDIVKNFRVGQAIVGHVPASDVEFGRFASLFVENRIPVARIVAGERFVLQGVTIEVLWPQPDAGETARSANDQSIVLRLVYGATSILLTGDIERISEEAILASGVDLRSDVLKAPHHGSKTSSTEAFIKAVQPGCVIISVGERSRFGHPSNSVTSRYREIGARLFQTGRDGTVTVETDGTSISVGTHKNNVGSLMIRK